MWVVSCISGEENSVVWPRCLRNRLRKRTCSIDRWNDAFIVNKIIKILLSKLDRPGVEMLPSFFSVTSVDCGGGGGEQRGLNLPFPVPFNPGSRPLFVGSHLFAFFRLRNFAQCCVIFPFFSRFPHPLLPPPVHLPPRPFSPGLPSPCPPPPMD